MKNPFETYSEEYLLYSVLFINTSLNTYTTIYVKHIHETIDIFTLVDYTYIRFL